MAGNVPVFDEEGDPVAGSGESDSLGDTKETVLIKEYDSKNAAIIKLFFKEELNDIAKHGLVSCNPENGPSLKLLIKCVKRKKEKVDPLIKDLDEKLDCIESREVSVPSDAFAKLAEHMRSEEKRQDGAQKKDRVLYRPDIVKKIVQVFYWPGNDQTVIKLKRELGVIETGGTRNRSASMDQAGASMQTGMDQLETRQPNQDKQDDGDYEPMEWQSTENPRKVKVDVEKVFSGKLKLLVYNDSILHLPVDAIVNAANNNMAHGGGVALVISEAAGRALDDESRKYVDRNGILPVSKNIVTTAGRLNYKGVIHAVGPQWNDYKHKEVNCLDDLYDTIENILFTCDRAGYKTVAMPAISAGIYGVPKELCSDMYVKAAANYSKISGKRLPEELHIVDIDQEILDLVKKSVQNYERDPESINQRVTVPKYLASRPQSSWRGRDRGQHHGRGRNRGHGSSQNHGSGHGQGYDSTLTQELPYEDLGISCEVKKLQEETFRWGAVAQLFALNKDLKVKIFKGDVTKSSKIDGLVCGIGTDMQFSGLVADALKTAGGSVFENAVFKKIQKSKREKHGKVMKCVPGQLKVTWVIFVVCDRLKDVDTKEHDMYRECVFNLLKKANEWKISKIAIPLFSTGYLQTNENKLQKCGIAFMQALDKFVDDKAGNHYNVKEIHLVNTSDLVTSTLVRVFDVASKTYGHNARKPAADKDAGRNTDGKKDYEHDQHKHDHRGSASGNNRSDEHTGGKSTVYTSQKSQHDNNVSSTNRKYYKNLNFQTSKGNGTPSDVNGGHYGACGVSRSEKDSGDKAGSTNERKDAISVSTPPSTPPDVSNSTQTTGKQTGNLVIIDDDEDKK